MPDNGRAELARRLHRVFITETDGTGRTPEPGEPTEDVPDETLLRFADDILAGDYTDPRWGPRRGDGGGAMRLVPDGH